MRIAAVCCTFLRPKQLGRMIKCFEEQDYSDRELIILDDAGQYDSQRGDHWRLVSVRHRYPNLGAKRNAAARLASPLAKAFAVWDDDDIYLPWALSASVAALKAAPWSRPSLVLHERSDGTLTSYPAGGLFHGCWAYTRRAFEQVGGYPHMNNGEDQSFAHKLTKIGIAHADPCKLGFNPFYIYCWGLEGGYHISWMGAKGYGELSRLPVEKEPLKITWPRDYRDVTIK